MKEYKQSVHLVFVVVQFMSSGTLHNYLISCWYRVGDELQIQVHTVVWQVSKNKTFKLDKKRKSIKIPLLIGCLLECEMNRSHAVPYRRVLSVICVVSQMLSLCNIGSNYSKQQSETTRLELVLTGGKNSWLIKHLPGTLIMHSIPEETQKFGSVTVSRTQQPLTHREWLNTNKIQPCSC